MRCGRSVADPPDDPVAVEVLGEVAERLVEFLDRAESLQPEQLTKEVLLERLCALVPKPRMCIGTATAARPPSPTAPP